MVVCSPVGASTPRALPPPSRVSQPVSATPTGVRTRPADCTPPDYSTPPATWSCCARTLGRPQRGRQGHRPPGAAPGRRRPGCAHGVERVGFEIVQKAAVAGIGILGRRFRPVQFWPSAPRPVGGVRGRVCFGATASISTATQNASPFSWAVWVFFGEAEHPLADNVALDLRRSAPDGLGAGKEEKSLGGCSPRSRDGPGAARPRTQTRCRPTRSESGLRDRECRWPGS